MQNDPTALEYDTLEAGNGPKFGVSSSPSTHFPLGSRGVVAWFTDLNHATTFALPLAWNVWDLELGELVQV